MTRFLSVSNTKSIHPSTSGNARILMNFDGSEKLIHIWCCYVNKRLIVKRLSRFAPYLRVTLCFRRLQNNSPNLSKITQRHINTFFALLSSTVPTTSWCGATPDLGVVAAPRALRWRRLQRLQRRWLLHVPDTSGDRPELSIRGFRGGQGRSTQRWSPWKHH